MAKTEKEEKLYQDRLKKLQALRDAGHNPYPVESERNMVIGEAISDFAKLEKSKKAVQLAGRLRSLRGHGKLVFGDLEDESGKIQLVFKADEVGDQIKDLENWYDVGDLIEARGSLFKTKRGERSVRVEKFKILSKSLRALPEKWHGLQDMETRLRKRYLDILSNPEAKGLFYKKASFWRVIRNFMEQRGFLEVQLPVLENIPGGAEAEPFITHHNALDRDFYLRISLELPLKRLIVAGYEKVFEIGRIFRNEGISPEHLQDYTQMEFYWAYADYRDLRKLLVELYRNIVKELFGGLKVTSRGHEINWGAKWKEYDYYELFKEYSGLDLGKVSDDQLRNRAVELDLEAEEHAGRGRLIDLIYKKTVRPHLIEPGFLVDPPVEIEPLAKRRADDPSRVERLQVMAWGTELGKGFSELNDPVDQRQRFADQMKLREAGDKEAQMMDEDFVEALEYGMPPTAGFGLSERLFAVLLDRPLRETVIFPPMKGK